MTTLGVCDCSPLEDPKLLSPERMFVFSLEKLAYCARMQHRLQGLWNESCLKEVLVKSCNWRSSFVMYSFSDENRGGALCREKKSNEPILRPVRLGVLLGRRLESGVEFSATLSSCSNFGGKFRCVYPGVNLELTVLAFLIFLTRPLFARFFGSRCWWH